MLLHRTALQMAIASTVLVSSPWIMPGSFVQAAQLSPAAVSQVAKKVTVLISGQNPGSGVIIDRQGDTYKVLTAFHVVGTPDEYTLITHDDQEYRLDYRQVKQIPNTDLALLEFKSQQSYPTADLGSSSQMSEGMDIYVTGFPVPSEAINLSIYNFTEGRLIANSSKLLTDGYSLVYSNSTQPGMSGGPVFDAEGKLIGIHGRADAKLQNGVYFKQNKNLGIAIDTFLTLAKGFTQQQGGSQSNPASISTAHVGNQSAKPPQITLNPSSGGQPPTLAPTTPQAGDYYLSALEKSIRGDDAGALQDLNRALAINPQFADAYSDRSTIKISQGDLKGAIADLDQAIRYDPKLAIAYASRGVYRAIDGNYSGANADINQAFQIRPEMAYAARTIVRWYQGDLSGALQDINVALPGAADNYERADMLLGRGVLQWQLGNPQATLTDLNQAIALQPNYGVLYLMRGLLFFQGQQFSQSSNDFQTALNLNPKDPDIYSIRSVLRLVTQNYSGVIQDTDQLLRLNPQADVYAARGLAYFQLGNLNQAMQEFRTGELRAQDAETRQGYRELLQAFSQIDMSNPFVTPFMQGVIQALVQELATSTITSEIKSFRPFQDLALGQ